MAGVILKNFGLSGKLNQSPAELGRLGKEEQEDGGMTFFSAEGKKNAGAKSALLRRGPSVIIGLGKVQEYQWFAGR